MNGLTRNVQREYIRLSTFNLTKSSREWRVSLVFFVFVFWLLTTRWMVTGGSTGPTDLVWLCACDSFHSGDTPGGFTKPRGPKYSTLWIYIHKYESEYEYVDRIHMIERRRGFFSCFNIWLFRILVHQGNLLRGVYKARGPLWAPPGGSTAWTALDGGTHRPTLAVFRHQWFCLHEWRTKPKRTMMEL